MAHVKVPGFVPLHKYMSREVLEALEILAWLVVADGEGDGEESPMWQVLQNQLPVENRQAYIDAIKEIGIVAQEARERKGG
jgi:hypothetical protein